MNSLILDATTIDNVHQRLTVPGFSVRIDDAHTTSKKKTLFHIANRLAKDEPTSAVVRYAYYDTFDWRLYRANSTMVVISDTQDTVIQWQTLDDGAIRASSAIDQIPHFAEDFPAGTMRDQLKPLLELRALLPIAQLHSYPTTLSVLNDDEKTVAHLVCTEYRLLDQQTQEEQRLAYTIQILPLKGYAKAATRLHRQLTDDFGLRPMTEHLLLKALTLLQRQPGDYSSKFAMQLVPTVRSDTTTKAILLHLLETMERNEGGLRANIDSEFLHDFRVAVRRTRSALTQIKGVLPESVVQHYREEFRWLGQSTGSLRDLDVYLLRFDDYCNELPAELRADLAPFRDFLTAHQLQAHSTSVQLLDSKRYSDLIKTWRMFLEFPASTTVNDATLPIPPHAATPIAEVANARIWRVYRRVLKEGAAITPETPAAALHELRITCKKLRYLMEFFQSLYPPRAIKRLIDVLKVLQNNLGDFQDFEVQIINLREFAQQMMDEGKTPAVTLMAMGILVEHLTERQLAARLEFADRFHQFAKLKNRTRFKKLFGSRTRSM